MPRRVDQVKDVRNTAGFIGHSDRLHLDRNPPLALELHRVENLILHLALVYSMGDLKQTISKGGLAVVYMSDDSEIADPGLVHSFLILTEKPFL